MTNKFILLASLVILLIVNGTLSCGGGRKRTQSGLGFGNGGITYTFRNGVYVTGTGTINPFSVRVGVGIRFKRDTTGLNGTLNNGGEILIIS